jgi:hypothetical protein
MFTWTFLEHVDQRPRSNMPGCSPWVDIFLKVPVFPLKAEGHRRTPDMRGLASRENPTSADARELKSCASPMKTVGGTQRCLATTVLEGYTSLPAGQIRRQQRGREGGGGVVCLLGLVASRVDPSGAALG